jgi:hypothetical protein
MSDGDLLGRVEGLSREAYALARAKADGGAEQGDLRNQAEAIDRELDELVPTIQAATGDEVEAIRTVWTDARSDVMWVLSDGDLPTSLRLGAYLRDRERPPSPS